MLHFAANGCYAGHTLFPLTRHNLNVSLLGERQVLCNEQGFSGPSGVGREPLQLPGDEIHNVVGVAFGADAIHVPLPTPRDRVENKQARTAAIS
jgi:hypothetical protein